MNNVANSTDVMDTVPDPLSPDLVRAQLERILAAGEFSNAGRISRLLRYVVDRTVAGEGDQLKEYVVGTEVFDRGSDYDPRLDSIVRVEARRLRARLDDYYKGPGNADPIVITMPRGSYVPSFARRQEPDLVAAPDLVPAAPPASASARSESPASYGETSPKRPFGREGGPAAPAGPPPHARTAARAWRSLAI